MNRLTVSALIKTMLQYSARKKNTKGMAECSVIKPAVSSDSASLISKGVRDVSARIEIMNIIKTGRIGIKIQIDC
jgi:hypothetical protein